MKATLRLFNAVQVEAKADSLDQRATIERTIRNGYILDPAIEPTADLLTEIDEVVGISGEKANAAFHKSWSVIQDTPQEALWLQAIVHYFTTYGFEALGIYNQHTIYIPAETLELPDIKGDIPLTVIKAMTADELLDGITRLGSGAALGQQTLDDIMTIVGANKYGGGFVEKITNRELKALLYDYYGLVPAEPVEFLRHLISKLTDESLVIKNDYLIGKIKESNGKFLDEMLTKAPPDLASIFHRYKPLFLAMKSISRKKRFFNRLRKQANKLHKPLPVDYLNSVTSQLKHGELDFSDLERKLRKASVFRKIRLAYALKYRTNPSDSILYRVRNGRGWATKFSWPHDLYHTQTALNVVTGSIIADLRQNVEGKTVYIPANVHYALPATEKQFTGHLPTGSYVSVPQDMIVGIHWTDTDKRVDLDLSAISGAGKTGWDSNYRSDGNNVLFSGDNTAAPKGAAELFYLKRGISEPLILMLNYYNFTDGDEVETKILVAHESPQNFGKNYMVDISNIIAAANINITKAQNILGLVVNIDGQNRFYFANVSIGNSITSDGNAQSTHVRRYLESSLVNSLSLNEVLILAGANVTTEKPVGEHLDLSPTALDKTTILRLIQP